MTIIDGTILNNRYRVDAFIGRGGMAEVYKVWDLQRSVTLAIKVLNPELAEDKVFLRRFQREAQMLSKLQHPNILRFYGLESSDGLVYMVLDYVDGITLRRMIHLEDKPLSNDMASEILNQVCSALFYAHKLGVVHCDIKPANIMIDQTGKVLVTDFGISRLTESATATLVGAGTPAYMSPEQIKGRDPIPSMDIYSLGVVMFEMFTGGERPFVGENASTTGSTSERIRWEQLHAEPPDPQIINPALSTGISSLILKCLNKDPEYRVKTMQDLQERINSVLPMGDGKSLARFMAHTETPADYVSPPIQIQSRPPISAPVRNADYGPTSPKKSKTGWIIGISLVSVAILIIIISAISDNRNRSSRSYSSSSYSNPTATATKKPTRTPTKKPKATGTPQPTIAPTKEPTKKPTSKPAPTSTPSKVSVKVINYTQYTWDVYFSHDRMCTLTSGAYCTFNAPPGEWSMEVCQPGVYPCNNLQRFTFSGSYMEFPIR